MLKLVDKCNKMTCPICGTVSCYVCKRELTDGYGHFDEQVSLAA